MSPARSLDSAEIKDQRLSHENSKINQPLNSQLISNTRSRRGTPNVNMTIQLSVRHRKKEQRSKMTHSDLSGERCGLLAGANGRLVREELTDE